MPYDQDESGWSREEENRFSFYLIHFVRVRSSSICLQIRQKRVHKWPSQNHKQKAEELCAAASIVKGLVVVRPLCLHWCMLLESGIKSPANDEPAHFTGACPYLIELGIPQEASHGIVIDVTVPTCRQKEARSHFFSLL